jgi:hypothetical protein
MSKRCGLCAYFEKIDVLLEARKFLPVRGPHGFITYGCCSAPIPDCVSDKNQNIMRDRHTGCPCFTSKEPQE